jgi:LysR family glycine cleavage system transcriptional activator
MTHPLRSLSGLLDFECAARRGSFKLAAHELHKTAAAVSQQVKQLEDSVGFALFIRYPRHVVLTAKGQDLAATVSRLVGELRAKVAALHDGDEESILRISATHSFAIKWLVPRLHRFTLLHPELDIRLDANDQPVNLDDDSTDVAIRYGAATGNSADTVFHDPLVVAYSPALLAPGQAALSLSDDLPRQPLLYEGSTECWITLLHANKALDQTYHFARGYSHSGLLTQAAVAGQGVALVPYMIACEDVRKGALHLLPCRSTPSGESYRLLVNRSKAAMPKIAHFRAWIQQEMDDMVREMPRFARGESP